MPENSQLTECFFGEQFSDQAKSSLRKDVCKDLPVEFEQDGKFYCVLHFPNNQKLENTDFGEIVKQRIDSQENNFCGVYFPGKTDYFFNHKFETEAVFERTFFEDAFFKKSIFNEIVSFSFAKLKRADFQECQFRKQSFFIGATFASETYQREEHLAINFSAASFEDAIFQDCIFNKHPHFNDNVFEEAGFLRTKFLKGASFFSTKFINRVRFDSAIFQGTTTFNNTVFDCDESSKTSSQQKSFNITASFSGVKFEDVSFTKTIFEAVYFKETIFDKVQFWESTFNSLVDFESATFKTLDFYKVLFGNEAHFKKATFKGKGGFFWSRFIDKVQFNEAIFEPTCDILFNFTSFEQLLDFSSANISGYLSFNGSDDEKVFFNKTDLNLEFIRIEKPEKVSFHTVDLHPYWFVNVDSRKFTFANIDWGKDFGSQNYKIDELKKISNRGNENPEQIFKISCRQLAENAENNNRLEEASKFRRMAFETERLERKEKISNWRSKKYSCSEVVPSFWDHLKLLPYDFSHFAYRFSSYYGESSIRAFIVLTGIIFIAAFLYWIPLSQFPNKETFRSLDLFESFFYSLRVMVLQRPEPFPANTFGKAVLALESIFAPVQLALLALAIRRKFMR